MRRILLTIITLCLVLTTASAQAKKGSKNKNTAPAVNYPEVIQKLMDAYQFDTASERIDEWEDHLERSNSAVPAQLAEMRSRAICGRNQLERVEKIQLIDTLNVDSVDFVKAYMLSSAAGELSDMSVLPDEYADSNPTMVFVPQDGKHLYWSMPLDDQRQGIVVSDVLDDGTITAPVSMGDEINGLEASDYPYIMEDGLTVYFSAKGEGTLGGYDIFMTRISPDGEVLQPQNIGMPYNSTSNDMMMVIDESRNLGWWASDRNHIPGKVTIYVFRPSQMRVNHSPDDEHIIDYASLSNVPLAGGLDELLVDPVRVDNDQPEFMLSLGDGRVYTHLDQFSNPQAKAQIKDLLFAKLELERLQTELDQLRIDYGMGDRKAGARIHELEKSVNDSRNSITRLTNRIIGLELKNE